MQITLPKLEAQTLATIDGTEATASVAYRVNDLMAIYPITPSSGMAEFADAWSAAGRKNIWGTVPFVQEMQSEGGAAGVLHGALQLGTLATTFTASQGLLLMIPNMYKIAGELTPTVFHIAARSLATQGLSIFGDHSDVMAARATGWGMLFANNVQEAGDFALIAQAATLETRVPFLHIMDGFRTSHEINKIALLEDEVLRAMIDMDAVRAHRSRGLKPEQPSIRGTAQNPDVYFQARESANPFYAVAPEIVQRVMDKFAGLTGRQYRAFEFVGASDAERVVVVMGSGVETVEETVNHLVSSGEKVGVLKVRLYRPFSVELLLAALPKTVKSIAVLDRTKEPGASGEPLYQDVVTALSESFSSGTMPFSGFPRVIGGRYGLSSKEFTPAMVLAVFRELEKAQPKTHFTVGINDDVTHTSLDYDASFNLEPADQVRAIFYGLGSDGTVGANKNSIKIIGEGTDLNAQGYFVYDSKKSGSRTISHLRFGPSPIRAPYLIGKASFVAIHQWNFLERFEMLNEADQSATVLLNSPYSPSETWQKLPAAVQKTILEKNLELYVIDGDRVARDAGMGNRVNTVMQTCFFALAKVLPKDQAIAKIKDTIQKTYGKRGKAVVEQNFKAVDSTLEHLSRVDIPSAASSQIAMIPPVPNDAPDFVRNVLGVMIAGHGDSLPVSAMPIDGTYPSGTTKHEKRSIADFVPVWETDLCIQCGKCVLVCPHAVIRAKVYEPAQLENAPKDFKSAAAMWKELPNTLYSLQVAVEDCTGCSLCVEVCPAKDKSHAGRKAINMMPQAPLVETERKNWDFFLGLPEILEQTSDALKFTNVKNVQLLEPLFEFSGACAGCGETPYLKLMSQLFGDRAIIANATGCSSIYGGNLPTTPWSMNKLGRGPAWSNSLFEDNAEYGLGMRLTVEKQNQYARELVSRLSDRLGEELTKGLLEADQHDQAGIDAQRIRVEELKQKLEHLPDNEAKDLSSLADVLVEKSVWIVGGDGWAYDIGYGGLDHVIASGANVNILVMDTEVYSNTGGQASKSTPMAAVAKFASAGKPRSKKNLGRLAMEYGNVYVAQIAMGASDSQTVKAFLEAERYDGVSIIIAYSHCIAHGIDMSKGLEQQKLASISGHWPLYRFDPRLKLEGKNPLQLDSKAPSIPLKEYAYNETRYKMMAQSNPEAAEALMKEAQSQVNMHWLELERMAKSYE